MTQNDDQETRESPALDADGAEVRFTRADVESVGDPAAAGTGAEEGFGDSPAAAHARVDSSDPSPGERPELQILGAFLGAFVVAKILKRLFGRDD